MNKKFDWKELDPKVAELIRTTRLEIPDIAQMLGASKQTVQRSMRRQGINRYKVVPRG
jgi:hypothetical protein